MKFVSTFGMKGHSLGAFLRMLRISCFRATGYWVNDTMSMRAQVFFLRGK